MLLAQAASSGDVHATASAAEEARAGIAAVDAPAPSGLAPVKRIEVILSTQHLIGWEDDQVAFEYAVTTGQEGQPTLPGEYEILDKEESAYSAAWALTMPYWLGIYQYGDYENGFHALPIDEAGDEFWSDALGVYPASHGCVVLARADAQHLYEWADIGTKVEIHD